MKKTIFVFSALILALLALFQLGKYAYFFGNGPMEPVLAVIALVFLTLGLFLNTRRKTKWHTGAAKLNHQKIREFGLSNRELEVLVEISNGLSNKEIGEKLFVSESTIKTHVSNILVKLEAKRRTHAVQRAKELGILST